MRWKRRRRRGSAGNSQPPPPPHSAPQPGTWGRVAREQGQSWRGLGPPPPPHSAPQPGTGGCVARERGQSWRGLGLPPPPHSAPQPRTGGCVARERGQSWRGLGDAGALLLQQKPRAAAFSPSCSAPPSSPLVPARKRAGWLFCTLGQRGALWSRGPTSTSPRHSWAGLRPLSPPR